jgi:hypothetical protein
MALFGGLAGGGSKRSVVGRVEVAVGIVDVRPARLSDGRAAAVPMARLALAIRHSVGKQSSAKSERIARRWALATLAC